MLLTVVAFSAAAFLAPASAPRPATTSRTAVGGLRMSADLATWLENSAGVAPKFIGAVMDTCEDEMIGSVSNLALLNEAGMLEKVFKPVIAASIKTALDGASAGGAATDGGTATATATATVPMVEVKRMLMKEGQTTWGSEEALRARYDMFYKQGRLESAQWDTATGTWATPVPFVNPNTGVPSSSGPFAVPAVPADFSGGQWIPTAAAGDAAVVVAPPAAAPAAAAPAPAPVASPAAVPPAGDKDTFTVTLKNPDGDQVVEVSGEEYLLDYLEELDNAEDYEHLPYACRAGSCSACAGKLVSGTMDVSGCSFLTPEQKADGWVLTCTAKATSDCVIETHKEDDMY